MKNILLFAFLFLTININAYAQTPSAELEKIRRIKFLESTREDVKRILSNYKILDAQVESFSGGNADFEISYTDGDCSDEDSGEIWNVPEGRVKLIEITLDDSDELTLETFGFNESNFQKEQEYVNIEDQFIYHNRDFGIAFRVYEGEVKTIFLFPSRSYRLMLCDNEMAKGFLLSESWFIEKDLEKRYSNAGHHPANVTDLQLSATEIIIGCKSPAKNAGCPDTEWKISVETAAAVPQNDTITYEYTVSGGRIIGSGANVVWDLSGVQPGEYTITAGANDRCGICGQTMTKTVTVKECPDCPEK